ncbi:hypothetical protein EQK42_29175, partial [Streptomyces albidoflavus]
MATRSPATTRPPIGRCDFRSLRRTTSARSSAGSMNDELAEGNVPEIWAGVDIGKTHHHAVVI